MRVHLADVGDIAPIFGPRRDVRARSLRRQSGGEGGGTPPADDPGSSDDDDSDGSDDDNEENEEDEKDPEKKPKDPELEKAIKARDRVKAENRRLKAELAASAKKDDDDAPDPEKVADTKIVRTAAHGILRGLGIEDKDDRVAVLDLLRLDDVSVDADGADEDEIEERIDRLRDILGGPKSRTARVPRTVKANRETKETNTDPDKARYRRIMGVQR